MSDIEEALHPRDEEQRVYALVTGANRYVIGQIRSISNADGLQWPWFWNMLPTNR